MAAHNGSKYERKDLEKLLKDLGFTPDVNNGKTLGKGGHIVYSHGLYSELKIVMPHKSKTVTENEMNNIGGNLIIAMNILGMDTSIFKRKEGLEGKMMKLSNAYNNDPCSLFSKTVKNCLGIRDNSDVNKYIEDAMKRVFEAKNKFKK